MAPLAVRFHNVARGPEHEGEGSDPALWAPVDRARRGRAGRSSARSAGAAAVRLHGAAAATGRCRATSSPRRCGPIPRRAPRTGRCERCSRGCARRSDRTRSSAATRSRSSSPSRPGSTSRRRRRSCLAPTRRSIATTRGPPGRSRRCRSTSRRAACCPASTPTGLSRDRRDLAELRLQALEVIGRAGLELGGTQLGSVERAGRALIELERFRESGYVLLMEALAAQGNIAEGVRVFERLRRLLRDDLGTAPSREAIAVHERLLGTGPARRAGSRRHDDKPADATAGQPELELPAALRVLAEDTLVGRETELTAIRDWWTRGRERMLLLAGEAGMGKTRLQAELASEVHAAGAIVLAGHAPDEALVPYQPLIEAIGQFAFGAPLKDLRAVIRRTGEAGADLARLIPEIRRRVPDLPPLRAGDPDTDRYRLFEAVADLLGSVAVAGPLLITLDDLHWADRPTLLMLRHLLRSPQAANLRILGAYRTGELGAGELTATVAPLRREGLLRGLDVAGLGREDAVELLRLRAGGTPVGGARARALPGDRGQPAVPVGDRPPPAGVRHPAAGGRAGRPAARRPPRRRARAHLPAAGAPQPGRAGVAARRRGHRPRVRGLAAGGGARVRRGPVPGGAGGGAGGAADRRGARCSRPLRVLARAGARDALRGDLVAAPAADAPARRACARGPGGRPRRRARRGERRDRERDHRARASLHPRG